MSERRPELVTALPERTTEPRPAPGARRTPRLVGPIADAGRVQAVIAGGRVSLRAPRDEDRFALETAVATAGLPYDRKQNRRLPALRRILRRGTSRFESLALHAELLGLELTVDAAARDAIEGYREHLRRALSPIPRTVWVDETKDPEGELAEELPFRRR